MIPILRYGEVGEDQIFARVQPKVDVEKIVSAGHEMGTHSRTHSYMSKLSKEDIHDELTTSSAAIEKLTGFKYEGQIYGAAV